jgi:hypothetical protein
VIERPGNAAEDERPSSSGDSETPSLNWVVIAAYAVIGAAIIAAGWALNRFAGWDVVVRDIAINIGTTIGLVGIIVALQRRVDERTERVERRLDEVAVQLGPSQDLSGRLDDRERILSEYRGAVSSRAPSEYVDEDDVLAKHERRRQAALDHVAAVEARVRAAGPPAGVDAETWESMSELAQTAALGEDPAPTSELSPFPDDPLDPMEPLRDWWSAEGGSIYSRWSQVWRAKRLPHLEQELVTRLEMATLYATTADLANGLRAYHLTALACEEIIAVALDATMVLFPDAFQATILAPPSYGAGGLEHRWQQIQPDAIPGIVGRTIGDILKLGESTSSSRREVYTFATDKREAWRDRQNRSVEGFNRVVFPKSFALPLVNRTVAAVNALRIPNVHLPTPDSFDLTPATAGPYVWSPTGEPWHRGAPEDQAAAMKALARLFGNEAV